MPEALAPLRSAEFRWFFVGRAGSIFGSSLVNVALAFAVLHISDSASDLGIVLAAHSIPQVIFLLFGGVISDRFSRSRILTISNLVTGVTQGMVALLLLSGHATIWQVAALEAVNGASSAFTMPALMSVVPLVVERAQLQKANAMLAFTRNAAYIIGPAVAAVIVAVSNAGWALAFDAVTYVLCAVCMSKLRLPAADRIEKTSVMHDLRVGWQEFIKRDWVWVIVAAFGLLNMLTALVTMTLGPVIAKSTFGVGGWGLAQSAQAGGFLLMSLVLLRVRLQFPLRAGMLGMIGVAVPMLFLGVAPTTLMMVLAGFVAGAGSEVFGIGWITALQEHVPNEVLARVSSYDALGSFIAIPIGQLMAGPAAALWGERDVAVVSTIAFLVIVALTFLSPGVRNLRHVDAT